MREGLALVISAPSGAGKSTLISKLRSEFPNLAFSVSCTTRSRRPQEQHGRDYFFISQDEFDQMRAAGEFAEWAQVHGNLYGTPLAPLRAMLREGRDVIFDIDVEGAAQLRATLPDAVSIFILPPSIPELENRLRQREGTDAQSLKRRLEDVEAELRESFWYDRIIVNDDLDAAYAGLKACYVAATHMPSRYRSFLNQLMEEARAWRN